MLVSVLVALVAFVLGMLLTSRLRRRSALRRLLALFPARSYAYAVEGTPWRRGLFGSVRDPYDLNSGGTPLSLSARGDHTSVALQVLSNRLPMPVEQAVLETEGDLLVLSALLSRPTLEQRARAAAAVFFTERGIISHELVGEEYMSAALTYRRSLASWPQLEVHYGSLHHVTQNVDHVLSLLDPDVAETYSVLAQDWNGLPGEVIEASRRALVR